MYHPPHKKGFPTQKQPEELLSCVWSLLPVKVGSASCCKQLTSHISDNKLDNPLAKLNVCQAKCLVLVVTPEGAVLTANALVSSCLDYCNSLFRG